MNLDELLEKLDACEESREWASTQPDLQTAWKACERGDWMLWLLRHSAVPKNDSRFRLIACDVAESVVHLVPPGEDRPRMAIETARKYAKGEATRTELAHACAAADDACSAAYEACSAADDACSAAYEACCAAYEAAYAAHHAALNAAYAALNAAHAAYYAAYFAARAAYDAVASSSDTVRKYFPECPEIKGV